MGLGEKLVQQRTRNHACYLQSSLTFFETLNRRVKFHRKRFTHIKANNIKLISE